MDQTQNTETKTADEIFAMHVCDTLKLLLTFYF